MSAVSHPTGNVLPTQFEKEVASVRNIAAIGAVALLGVAFETQSARFAEASLIPATLAMGAELVRRAAHYITHRIV